MFESWQMFKQFHVFFSVCLPGYQLQFNLRPQGPLVAMGYFIQARIKIFFLSCFTAFNNFQWKPIFLEHPPVSLLFLAECGFQIGFIVVAQLVLRAMS